MQRSGYFLLIFLIHFGNFSFSQVWNSEIDNMLNELGSPTPLLKDFEAFGIKDRNNLSNLNNAAQWIEDFHNNLNEYQFSTDSFMNGAVWNENLIFERKTNQDLPWIILGAHYDTRGGPGCNDNGSGVVTCMRIAQLVVEKNLDINLRIIYFAGEEDGLVGSRHYVRKTLNPNDSILFMFNLDQLGGTANDPVRNARIICERDEMMTVVENNLPSKLLTDTLYRLTELYTGLIPVISYAYASDYVPFENAGYVITGLYQFEGINYPGYHNSLDVLMQMDTNALKEVMRAATALILHYGGYRKIVNIDKISISPQPSIFVYPNPARNTFQLQNDSPKAYNVTIISSDGKLIDQQIIDANSTREMNLLNAGLYHIIFHSEDGLDNLSKRLIIAQNF